MSVAILFVFLLCAQVICSVGAQSTAAPTTVAPNTAWPSLYAQMCVYGNVGCTGDPILCDWARSPVPFITANQYVTLYLGCLNSTMAMVNYLSTNTIDPSTPVNHAYDVPKRTGVCDTYTYAIYRCSAAAPIDTSTIDTMWEIIAITLICATGLMAMLMIYMCACRTVPAGTAETKSLVT